MNKNDMELLKSSPSMLKGIAVEADRLNDGHNLSLTLDDVQGITEFGLALGCQIHKADKVNTGKLFTLFLVVVIDIVAKRSLFLMKKYRNTTIEIFFVPLRKI